MIESSTFKPFRLSEAFLSKYTSIKPPFGFNGLGEIVFMRSYSRNDDLKGNERWWETCERVVNGTYNMQKRHIENSGLEWNPQKAQFSAQEMYSRMFNMKFLPPGRGIRNMGSNITEERKLFAALNNCAFCSTEHIKSEPTKAFEFMMDMSMLGVGVGFDVRGANELTIKMPVVTNLDALLYIIPDSREGWVTSLRMLLESYLAGGKRVSFSYSEVRGPGEPIRGFGGISSGPAPLISMHENIKAIFEANIGKLLDEELIVDIMNHIGVCVVSGNVRRTAQIVFGDPNDKKYISLKDYKWNKEQKIYIGPRADRAAVGWASNNSVFAELGMDYTDTANRTRKNGEPGYVWLENMKGYGKMVNGPDNVDHRASGANPCVEQTLEDKEVCTLVETFPANHDSLEDFKRTLKFAYLYAKTVTLGKTHWPETNRVMLRNRRIGCSVSGVQQFVVQNNIHTLKLWLQEGYSAIRHWDDVYSDWFAIPRSIKVTSVKPSGSVSLLAGATPGMHWPVSRFQIRRVRMPKDGLLAKRIRTAGYKVEPEAVSPNTTIVVEIPIDVGEGIRPVSEVSMWEQLHMAAFLQKYWADNQVSSTVTFDPETEGKDIAHALNYFQYMLKGISFLPNEDEPYEQMPIEYINEDDYNSRMAEIKPVNFSNINHDETEVERFCDGDTCMV